MNTMKTHEFWFVVGSQSLYGADVLETVDARAKEMAEKITADKHIPCTLVYKGTVKDPDEIAAICKEANYQDACCGMVVWMHTFSPSKMWINGLHLLQKPYCHFATQYNRLIPNEEIDMDFMNLNQAAHGDREHGYIGARMDLRRKVIMGYWQDDQPLCELADWMRAAVGWKVSQNLRVVRFGDNMREVAVTEGDKVGTQMQLGWQVNTWAVGYLAERMQQVTDAQIDAYYAQCHEKYTLDDKDAQTIRYQLREEIAIEQILQEQKAGAFVNTFQDLYGMQQLPGLASQRLMEKGYGYGGEGDWKVSALTHVIKQMTAGMGGGTSFMEDYTYHFAPGQEYSLGAHMLEVCPTIAAEKPRIEVHPLGIGDREPPARLVFEAHAGTAVVVSLIDLGGRLRMIVQDVRAVKPIMPMPNLPVARAMWQAMPDLCTGAKLWILAGGAHHTVFSYDATPGMLRDWAQMMDIEFVHIHAQSEPESFRQQLLLSDLIWKLRR